MIYEVWKQSKLVFSRRIGHVSATNEGDAKNTAEMCFPHNSLETIVVAKARNQAKAKQLHADEVAEFKAFIEYMNQPSVEVN